MRPQTSFVITKKWGKNTPIRVGITADEQTPRIGTGIEISMSTDDFIAALIAEVGSPAFIMTRKQLDSKIRTAVLAIEEELKSHTTQVVSQS